jgi:hypothetical protein
MVKVNTIRRQGEFWTREDIRTLRQLFRNNSNVDVAVLLERTPKSVERKAAKLGLTKTKKYLRTLGRIV